MTLSETIFSRNDTKIQRQQVYHHSLRSHSFWEMYSHWSIVDFLRPRSVSVKYFRHCQCIASSIRTEIVWLKQKPKDFSVQLIFTSPGVNLSLGLAIINTRNGVNRSAVISSRWLKDHFVLAFSLLIKLPLTSIISNFSNAFVIF